VGEATGRNVPPEYATCFGGGIGGCGSTCGALSGAVLVLGAFFGRTRPHPRDKRQAYSAAAEVFRSFRESFHSTQCWELTADEGSRSRRTEICPPYVRRAAQLVMEVLASTPRT